MAENFVGLQAAYPTFQIANKTTITQTLTTISGETQVPAQTTISIASADLYSMPDSGIFYIAYPTSEILRSFGIFASATTEIGNDDPLSANNTKVSAEDNGNGTLTLTLSYTDGTYDKIVTPDLRGQQGFTPQFSIEQRENDRVLRVNDWFGANNDQAKPAVGYVTDNGEITSDIGLAVNIRGVQGIVGPHGIPPNITGVVDSNGNLLITADYQNTIYPIEDYEDIEPVVSNAGRVVPLVRGTFSSSMQYAPLDEVLYNGDLYRVKPGVTLTIGTLPTDTTKFSLVGLRGATGVGITGITRTLHGDGTVDLIFQKSDGSTATLNLDFAATHTHVISDVNGLQTALDNKLNLSQATAQALTFMAAATQIDQRAALGLGSLATANSVPGSAIDDGTISNAKIAPVPSGTLKGRVSTGTGVVEDLTVVQVKQLLAITAEDITGLDDQFADIASNYALLDSPNFIGSPTAPTLANGDSSNRLATTSFVASAIENLTETLPEVLETVQNIIDSIGDDQTGIQAIFDALTDRYTKSESDGKYALNDSPLFVGNPRVPVPPSNDDTNSIAPTNWVRTLTNALAPRTSPAFNGTPTTPTAAPGTNTSQIASTAFIQAALGTKANADHLHTIAQITDLQTALNAKAAQIHTHPISDIVNLQSALDSKFSNLGGIVSGALSVVGSGSAILSVNGDITAARGASSGYVLFGTNGNRYIGYDGSFYVMPNADLKVNGYDVITSANLGSKLGISPAGAVGTVGSRLQSISNVADNASAKADNAIAAADAANTALLDKFDKTGGVINGVTEIRGPSTNVLKISSEVSGPLIAFYANANYTSRQGYVQSHADGLILHPEGGSEGGVPFKILKNRTIVTTASYASPTLIGVPTSPTAAAGTNTTQIATTAFVQAYRDATKANLDSPALTGVPTAPTAAVATSTTQIASTAYVQGEFTAFRGRHSTIGALDSHLLCYYSTTGTSIGSQVPDFGQSVAGSTLYTTTSAGSQNTSGGTWRCMGLVRDYNNLVRGLFVRYV